MSDESRRPTEVRRSEAVLWRRVGADTVLLNAETGRCMSLNATGTRLWESLKMPSGTAALAAVLAAEWQLAQDRADADVVAFCESLADRGMVTLTLPGAPPA